MTEPPTSGSAAEGLASRADHLLAETLAREAGEMLVAFRKEGFESRSNPWMLQDDADMAAHRFIVDRLAQERPDDAVLSEEGHDDRTRLGQRRVWIIDPLDGSNSFSARGADDWAVHIALSIDGEPVCGAVSMPSVGDVASTANPPEVPEVESESPVVVVSRQTMRWHGQDLADALGARVIGFGSAGAKAMAVVRGSADAYFTDGGLYEWDSCAPVAVALAAGLHCSRLDGSTPSYNNKQLFVPGLLICRPEMAEPILDLIEIR